MEESAKKAGGMRAFMIVMIGQVVSMLGTGMTNFAVGVWIYQETGEATAFTWAVVAFFAPSVLFSPVAGVIVDRANRRMVMIASDLIAGIITIAWVGLLIFADLQLWQIYIGNFVAGAANAFQFPAYSAAISMMLPKEQYGRAAGMQSLAQAASGILAPAFAGALLGVIGLAGIMVIDVITFLFAIGALLAVFIPQPEIVTERGSFWQDLVYGFDYIFKRPSLLGLQLVFFSINFLTMFGIAVMVPMILARSNNNELLLGSVQSIGAVGGVAGGLLLTVWGGPKRKVHGVLLGMFSIGIFGQMLMGLGQSLLIWGTAAFAGQFIIPILNGSNQAIWQAKVMPDVQGRVFSVRRLIAQITAPVAVAVAGPLADNFFEPGMNGGVLESSWSWLVGTGPGSGMGLMFILFGGFGALVGLAGYLFPAVRHAEDLLPDHEVVTKTAVFKQRVQALADKRQQLKQAPGTGEIAAELQSISHELRLIGTEYQKIAWKKG